MDYDLGRRIRNCLIDELYRRDVDMRAHLALRDDIELAEDFMRLDDWEKMIHMHRMHNWGYQSTKRFFTFIDHYHIRPRKKWCFPWERQ